MDLVIEFFLEFRQIDETIFDRILSEDYLHIYIFSEGPLVIRVPGCCLLFYMRPNWKRKNVRNTVYSEHEIQNMNILEADYFFNYCYSMCIIQLIEIFSKRIDVHNF